MIKQILAIVFFAIILFVFLSTMGCVLLKKSVPDMIPQTSFLDDKYGCDGNRNPIIDMYIVDDNGNVIR
jgi:hypothetical protein